MADFGKLIGQFKAVFPQWNGMPLTTEQSVKFMLPSIDRLGLKDSGAFISHFGNKQWL